MWVELSERSTSYVLRNKEQVIRSVKLAESVESGRNIWLLEKQKEFIEKAFTKSIVETLGGWN